MAAPVFAKDMIAIARGAAGVETLDEANALVTDPEALAVLNGELAELYDVILENGCGDFYRSIAPLTLVANKSIYTLSGDFAIADFYEIVSVDIVWTASVIKSAKLFMEAERNRFKRVLPLWSQFCDVWYRPNGNAIEFMPVPLTGISINMNYIPVFSPLTDVDGAAGQFDSVNQWHWMAIWGLAAYMAQKDDDEPKATLFLQRKADVRTRVEAMASRRIEGEPPRVQRSRRYDDEDIW